MDWLCKGEEHAARSRATSNWTGIALLTLALALGSAAASAKEGSSVTASNCFSCAPQIIQPGAPRGGPAIAHIPQIPVVARGTHKYRIDDDVVVRGWKMGAGLYFGHTRSRLGRAGVGITYDDGNTQYTLNHQGFTVTRRL